MADVTDKSSAIETLVLKKIFQVGRISMAIVIPVIGGISAYYVAMGKVDRRIDEVKIDIARTMVTKQDLQELKSAMEVLAEKQSRQGEDIARIRGILEHAK